MHDCRDPFVFDNGNEYVMFVAMEIKNGNDDVAMAIAYATSTDLVSWTWVDWIPATWPATPTQKAESPNLVKENGYYYLMWTFKSDALPQGGAVKIAFSTSIFGPYTVMSGSPYMFGIANETLIEPTRTIYAAFDDGFFLNFKRDIVFPLNPSSSSSVIIREFSECSPEYEILRSNDPN